VGALLAEKHEEWSTGRRYLKMDEFYGWQAEQTKDDADDLKPKLSSHTPQPA